MIKQSRFKFIFAAILLLGHFNLFSATSQTELSFTSIAKKATPAVVSIRVKTPVANPFSSFYDDGDNQLEDPFDFFGDNFFNRFFKRPNKKSHQQFQIAQGSGFIVSPDGYILTNAHVVREQEEITVKFNAGQELPAKLVGMDQNTDIAVIKVEGSNLPYLKFDDSDKLEVGQWVVAIGNPLGLQASLTVGVVSAKGRNNLDLARVEDFIQTDAAINRGNSGGPLLDLNGNVVGINTAIVTNMATGGYMGIGFAIPSNLAKHIMDELIQNGSVTRGFIGVTLQQITNDLAASFGLDDLEGALVSDVVKNSPAERGGLRQGDIILEYNGKKIPNTAVLRNAVSLMKPGEKVVLTILRDKKKIHTTLTIGTYPEEELHAKVEADKLGIEVEALTKEDAAGLGYNEQTGVLVSKVAPGSPAAWAGIKKGAIIVSVNQIKINSPKEFHDIISETDLSKPILLLIKQGAYMQYISLKIG